MELRLMSDGTYRSSKPEMLDCVDEMRKAKTTPSRLMSGSFQPFFGKLYSITPAKTVASTSLIIFVVGALISALAPSSSIFIVGRAVTGLATAGVTSGAFALVEPRRYFVHLELLKYILYSIIIQLMPLSHRSKYAGIGAAIEAVASLLAPLIGGALIDGLSWRWCFYVELPFLALAILSLLISPNLLKGRVLGGLSIPELARSLDLGGTAVFVSAFTLLILALQWGGKQYPWSDWRVLLPLGLSGALTLVFAHLQTRLGEKATMPPRILCRRSVLFGFLFAACNNGALSIVEYYVSPNQFLLPAKSESRLNFSLSYVSRCLRTFKQCNKFRRRPRGS